MGQTVAFACHHPSPLHAGMARWNGTLPIWVPSKAGCHPGPQSTGPSRTGTSLTTTLLRRAPPNSGRHLPDQAQSDQAPERHGLSAARILKGRAEAERASTNLGPKERISGETGLAELARLLVPVPEFWGRSPKARSLGRTDRPGKTSSGSLVPLQNGLLLAAELRYWLSLKRSPVIPGP